jgi:hypothetical protein
MVHNHPSGDPTPSRADIAMTKQVVQAVARSASPSMITPSSARTASTLDHIRRPAQQQIRPLRLRQIA